MTIKELKDWLAQFPDDATVMARVIARNGRGGTFQEDLILTSSHLDERDGEKLAYIDCGFEIGWLDNHPEFQPPTEPEDEVDEEPHGRSNGGQNEDVGSDKLTVRRNAILDRMRPIFAAVYPYPLEDSLSFAVMDVKPEKWLDLLKVCTSLKDSAIVDYSPESACQILDMHTFGELIDYLIDGKEAAY